MENIDLKKFTCEWCQKDLWFKSGRSFGAHKTGCKFNPKHASTKAKIAERIPRAENQSRLRVKDVRLIFNLKETLVLIM
jgi:hypothetical protein